jgi:hypothetical protein
MQEGLTVDRAYDIAERTLEKLFQERHPSPAPPRPKAEKVTPRVRCTQHREKVHIFSDGTVWKCCAHDECGWGRTRKSHTDGMEGGTLYAIDLPPTVEVEDEVDVSPDDPRELQADEMRGQPLDEGEVGIVPELPELDDEDSESEDDEELESCEA